MHRTSLLRFLGGGRGGIGARTLLLRGAKVRPRVKQQPLSLSDSATSAILSKGSKRPKKAVHRPPRSTARRGDVAALSLADFHPAIARTWIAAASNKMLQPQHVSPGSRKLAWWICPACHHQFNRRIDLHMLAGGECPQCKAKPSLTPPTAAAARRRGGSGTAAAQTADNEKRKDGSKKTKAATVDGTVPMASVAHRCRPDSSQSSLAADNANMLSKSVADDHYLRVQEQRNLLPMLAKSFDKERAKVGEDEVLRVSPKLDGIRCVVAYRQDTKQVLFFSRSGTLFECCDDAIEPAVRHLFAKDPTLVLDGELYNDSVNTAQLTKLLQTKPALAAKPGAAVDKEDGETGNTDAAGAFYRALLAAAPQHSKRLSKQSASGSGKKGRSARAAGKAAGSTYHCDDSVDSTIIRFEHLTSAIRTTRQHLTPAVAALQRQLQYHVFDVLYAREFPGGSAANVPFSVRYAYLESLLAEATAYNTAHIPGYNAMVLRCVPNVACTLSQVDGLLRAAMRIGYEGVMVRREDKGTHAGNAVVSAKKKLKAKAASCGGGYGFGQRSGTLLKYKVMQDAEYVIVGAVEGSGKWKGSLGSFICVTPNEKQRFTVTPASTDAEKKRMWRTWKQAYMGKALTVQYQELTPDGVPRFPVGKCVRGAADGHDWL